MIKGIKLQQSNRDKYIKHGSILAVTSFFVRIVGMLYRIPMTSIIGDRGNGLYSGAFEIYNIVDFNIHLAYGDIQDSIPYVCKQGFRLRIQIF